MKISFTKFLFASVMLFGLAAQAHAQTTPPMPSGKGNHPCMAEHQAVMAQCEKGDPCGTACKQAHKAMKQCRIANNIPTKPHTGMHKPSPCKSNGSAPTGSMPAPTAAPQTP